MILLLYAMYTANNSLTLTQCNCLCEFILSHSFTCINISRDINSHL